MRKENAVWMWVAVFGAILLIGALNAMAQGTASMSGVVEDSTGAVIPQANVTVTQTETNYTAKAISNGAGEFTLSSLPVGPYNLTVRAATFAPYTQKGIILKVAQVSNVHVDLTPGGVSQEVQVAADQASVQTTEATVETMVPEEIVKDLPLNGRQTNALVYTAPGVSDSTANVNGATSTNTGAGAMLTGEISPSAHGVSSGSTYFALDGANNIDSYAMLGAPFPNPDATQEFNVATSAYGARYMSAPGGAVNIVTKSGTNSIHGSAFEYIRNGFFNADQFGSLSPDELKRNQFGGALGGPIVKNKWFLFGSYQETIAGDANAEQNPVPSAAERAGTFSTQSGGTVTAGQLAGAAAIISSFTGSTNYITGISPAIHNLVTGYMPLANYTSSSGANYYKANIPSRTDTYEYIVKSDYDFGNHRVFGRYFRNHLQQPLYPMSPKDMNTAIGGKLNLFSQTGGGRQIWETAAIGDDWAKKAFILQSRASFNKGNADNIYPASSAAVTLPSLGAQNLTAGLQGGTGIQVVVGASGIAFAGVTSQYAGLPRETWDLSEDATLIKAKHEFSFGGEYRRLHYAEVNYAGQSGVYVYPGVTSSILAGFFGQSLTNAGIADYILGSPIQFIQQDGFFIGANQNVMGFYAEDKYRVTPNLNITGGLRYDPFLPIVTTNSKMTCWDPGQQSTVFTNAPKGINYPGDKGCSAAGTTNKLFNMQPRIGIAYDPYGKGRTSIRAGYGIYNMQEQLQMMIGMSAPPWSRGFEFNQPFLSIDNMWASAGASNPFAQGFHAPGYHPPSNVAYPAIPFTSGAIASDYTPGYIEQWSLSVQQGIGAHDIFQLAYVGTKGTHLGATYDDNLPTLYTAATYAAGTTDQARRPDQALAEVYVLRSNAASNYNAMEASLTHQMQWGLYLNTNYTWSKCLSEVAGPAATNTASNYPEPGSSVDTATTLYGLCNWDQNFMWRTSANWQLPALNGQNVLLRGILGKWTASGILSVEADTPFSITDGSDNSGSGLGFDRADHSTKNPNAPAWIPNTTGVGPNKMLNYAAFQDNAIGTYGNTGVNAYRDISHKDLDVALMKDFPISEQFRATFRAEAFNLANHANFTEPGVSYSSGPGSFGAYTGAGATRVMQFALRLAF